jgi:hypothetical protein
MQAARSPQASKSARVERTLLSAAFDVDFDLAFNFAFDFDSFLPPWLNPAPRQRAGRARLQPVPLSANNGAGFTTRRDDCFPSLLIFHEFRRIQLTAPQRRITLQPYALI